MTANKSIDGLSTRAAKKAVSSASLKTAPKSSARKSSVKRPAQKTKTAKAPSKPIPSSNPPIPSQEAESAEELLEISSLEIEVTPNEAPKKSKKSTKKPVSREQAIEDFLTPVQAFDFDEETGDLKTSEETLTEPEEEPMEETPSKKSKKPKKAEKTKKSHKKRRIFSIIILVIVLGLVGVVIWGVLWGNDIIAKITGGQGNVLDLLTFVDETYEPLKTDANGRTNILAFGTSGYNMEGDEGNGTHDGAQLTDSIMLISLNQNTGDIAMLSFPRDLKASRTCTATGKINEIYWCNNMNGDNEEAGATALMNEISNILGVDIQYYAHLNWGSLVQIVDLLGGIKVTLDEDILDYYWTGAVYYAGTEYTLNGEQALGLSRARHGTAGGDFSRGASQQKILIGIKDRVFERGLSISDMLSLASTLGDNLRTNFSLSDLKTLAHLTFDFDFDNMRQLSLYDPENNIYFMTTGTLDNGISYVFPRAGVGNYVTIRNYIAKMLSNDPRTYEEPSIIILNATGEAGLAASERDELVAEGYQIANIGDATSGIFDGDVTLYALSDSVSGTKSLLENYYNTDALSATDLPEGLPRDYDIVIVLGPSPLEEAEEAEE